MKVRRHGHTFKVCESGFCSGRERDVSVRTLWQGAAT